MHPLPFAVASHGWEVSQHRVSGRALHQCSDRGTPKSGDVGSDRGALSAFRLVGFPGPPSEPDVQLPLHPALHVFMPLLVQPVSASHVPAARPQPGQRCAGIHQRPPRSTVRLRTHWTPSPCDRLSRPRTTTGAPPHPTGISRQRTFPPTNLLLAGEGTDGMVPTFTSQPFDRVGAQLCPCNIATATPQPFTVASRADDLNRPKSHRTQHRCAGARCCAALIRQVRAAGYLEELSDAGSSRTPFCLACRTRTIWQC